MLVVKIKTLMLLFEVSLMKYADCGEDVVNIQVESFKKIRSGVII